MARAWELLSGGEGDAPSSTDSLGDGLQQLREAAHIDRHLEGLVQTVESALIQIEDVGRELASYRDSLEYDPARHEQVQTRLDLLRTLKKKYGASIERCWYASRPRLNFRRLIPAMNTGGTLSEEEESLRSRWPHWRAAFGTSAGGG